jgi:hypothetical protein
MGLTIPATIIATAEEVIEQRGPNCGLPATKVERRPELGVVAIVP